jgi:hypothetical protein
MIERSVNGKIIDTNNDEKYSINVEDTPNDDSTNVSITLKDSSSDERKGTKEVNMDTRTSIKSKSSSVKKQSSSFTKTDQDIFIELIIDELKRENREIKYTLAAREDKLEHAATRVSEMVVSSLVPLFKLLWYLRYKIEF